MNFVIEKERFLNLLYLTNSIVERRNTMPILANVRLSAENNQVSIAATDLEVSLVGEAEAKVKTPGSITVDARMIYEIIRELPNDQVRAQVSTGQRLEIECGQSRFKINGIASDEFPSLAGVNLQNPVPLEAQRLAEMIAKTAFAISSDETRYNINGVLLESIEGPLGPGKKVLRFVATDGHRLAFIDRPADGLNLERPVIIPRKGVQEIGKVLEGNDGAAQVAVSEGFVTIQSRSVTLGTRLVDGQFPDYRQVIPSTHSTTITVDRAPLLAAVKRVSLMTSDRSKAVKCKLTKGSLTISSSSPEYGEAADSLEVKQDGADVVIGFSARYLIDLLGAMERSDSVTIRLSGELGPGLFTGDDDELYTCLVMPMRFD